MRRLLLPLCRLPPTAGLALLLIGGAAFQPARAQALPGAGGYTVRGTVLNDATDQPVARAEVILGGEDAQLTASDGSFSFDAVATGTHRLSIRRPGYLGFGNGRSRESGPPRSILVGPEMPALTFRLTPLAAISGHLSLSTADPADHIRVTLFRRVFQNGRSRWSRASVTESRSDGSFRLANLLPGSYRVFTAASLDDPNEDSRGPMWGFPALYYPGVTDVGSAGVLILKAGQQAQADMTLVRQRFFPVTITVRGMPPAPTSFEVADTDGRSTGLPVRFDLRTEIAHANVPNGSWILIAHAFGVPMRFGRADFQVASAPVDLAVAVAPIPPIPVEINRDFTSTADGSLPLNRGPGMTLDLAPADEFAAGGGLQLSRSGQDGGASKYEIRVFQPGKFWIDTTNFPFTYVASVTSGGSDLATTPLTVNPSSSTPPIEVTLRNDPGTISGQIDSSSPGGAGSSGEQPRIWIYAIPLFPTTSHLREAAFLGNGQFSLPNLAPGSYRVVACDAPQEIDFHSAEGLAAWSGKGQVISLAPNGTANVELTVTHGEPAP
ncbi:MAG TPA: carboxypeptidase-like regulatory domain-containing protein [Acidobacteriaceae bacterium]